MKYVELKYNSIIKYSMKGKKSKYTVINFLKYT